MNLPIILINQQDGQRKKCFSFRFSNMFITQYTGIFTLNINNKPLKNYKTMFQKNNESYGKISDLENFKDLDIN